MTDTTIINSLAYYDIFNKKNKKMLDIIDSYIEMDNKIFMFVDKDNKELFKSRVETISIYIRDIKLWQWEWSSVNMDKVFLNIVKKLLKYGIDISESHREHIKSYLITSRFKITNDLELYVICSLIAYLSKTPYIWYDKKTSKYLFLLDFPEIV
jgi:hypothetical protein